MDVATIVSCVGDAAFGVDGNRRIVGWNPAAERVFGYPADQVLGRPCFEVMRGTDVFGNTYCRRECNVWMMTREGKPVRRFELEVPRACDGSRVRAAFNVLLVPGDQADQWNIVHVVCAADSAGSRPDAVSHASPPERDRDGASEVSEPLVSLSSRELEVLSMLSQGASTSQIADAMAISINTVRSHVDHILHKLGVHSKLEAVSLALRSRFV